jgi:Mediator of CRAC channel activity
MTEPDSTKNPTPLLDEFVRQTATQAALVAGFAFAILTTFTFDSATPYWRGQAFIICASLTICSELLAAFILATLGFVVKINSSDEMEDIFETEMNVAWGAYLVGFLAFLAALILLAWIKYRPAAAWVTLIVVIALTLGVLAVVSMVRKNKKLIV